jgi:hypothetical protein
MVGVRGSHYVLSAQVRPWYLGGRMYEFRLSDIPGKKPILDAQSIQPAFVDGHLRYWGFSDRRHFELSSCDLTVVNSHDAKITVRDSVDIELINNTTRGTYSSGIAVWDTNHNDRGPRRAHGIPVVRRPFVFVPQKVLPQFRRI